MRNVIQFCFFMCLSLSSFAQLDTEHFIPPVYPSTHGWTYPREQVVYLSTPTITPFNYTIKDGIVYHAKTLLAEVKAMVKKAKEN